MPATIIRENAEKARAFRTQAQELRASLLDETKQYSKAEIDDIAEKAAALDARAALVAGFTADREIDSQGGTGDNITDTRRTPAPGSENHTRAEGHKARNQELVRSIEDAFGGPNSLILALAQRNIKPLNTRQQEVLKALEAETRTITAATGADSGAEYLLPLQQVESIFMQPVSVGGIYQIARRFTVRGRTLRIPYLKQSDGDVNRPMSGGIADVSIVGEGELKPEFEPVFAQRLLTVYKYAGYTEIADETLADDMTGELAPTIQNIIGGAIVNKINEDVTADGTGSSMPMGAFHTNNPSLLKVTRQTANSVTVRDMFNLYSRHVLGPNSAWFIHPSAIPKFMEMTLGSATLVTWLPSLTGKPQMQFLGLPMIVTPLMAVLGTEGDVGLANGDFYALAVRQALTIESSIHYKFRNDVTAYRFFARAGGIPIPDGTYSYKSSSSTKVWETSPFVVLDNTVTS